MPKKQKENAVSDRKKKRGKPRKYGPGQVGLCRHVGVSMPGGLYDRLAIAARQTKQSRSAIVVAAVEAILSQSPDRLREQCGPQDRT